MIESHQFMSMWQFPWHHISNLSQGSSSCKWTTSSWGLSWCLYKAESRCHAHASRWKFFLERCERNQQKEFWDKHWENYTSRLPYTSQLNMARVYHAWRNPPNQAWSFKWVSSSITFAWLSFRRVLNANAPWATRAKDWKNWKACNVATTKAITINQKPTQIISGKLATKAKRCKTCSLTRKWFLPRFSVTFRELVSCSLKSQTRIPCSLMVCRLFCWNTGETASWYTGVSMHHYALPICSQGSISDNFTLSTYGHP